MQKIGDKMIIKNANNQTIKDICDNLGSKLLTDPLFMYLCPEKAVRHEYIDAYFNYYIYEWSRCDTLLCADANNALISLVDPDTFDYRFKGKGAFRMKRFKLASNVFLHRENIDSISEIIVPESREKRVMTVFGNVSTDIEAINQLIDEAIDLAQQENFVIIYDTFSSRLLPLMEQKGFRAVYQKNFLSTRFVQTVMVYNL